MADHAHFDSLYRQKKNLVGRLRSVPLRPDTKRAAGAVSELRLLPRRPVADAWPPREPLEFAAERLISPWDAAISTDLREEMQVVLGQLTAREELVLRWRFGIGEVGPRTLAEISECSGMSPRQICLIESLALRRLRRPSHRGRLRSTERT